MRISFLLAFVLLFNIVSAQTKFKKGTLVLKGSDKVVSLYIEDCNNFRNVNKITVKKGLDKKSMALSIDQLASFNIDERKYTIAPIEIADTVSNKILQVLESGRISMMYFKDGDAKEYMFVSKGETVHALLPKQFVKNNKVYTYEDEVTYRYILKKLMSDSEEIKSRVRRCAYNVSAISKLVNRYNSSSAEDREKVYTARKRGDNIRIDKYLIVGANFSELSVGEQAQSESGTSDLRGKEVGVKANIFLPNLTEYFSFEPGLFYGNKSSKNNINDAEVDINYLDLQMMLKFGINKGGIRPSIGVGMYFGYLMNPEKAFSFVDVRFNRRVFYKYIHYKEKEKGFLAEVCFDIVVKNKKRFALIFDYKKCDSFVRGTTLYVDGEFGVKLGYVF